MPVDPPESFQSRHLGPRAADLDDMLEVVRASSLDALIDETLPEPNRLTAPLDLPPGETEADYLERLRALAASNRPTRSYIGLGYYGCVTPSVILRNVLENPGWYTPYTPYQAEVAQGRLEALLNFQTMVEDLTGMEVANASLLDESTAAAEAMTMLHRIRARRKPGSANRFVGLGALPAADHRRHARACGATRSGTGGRGPGVPRRSTRQTFGVLIQYPDADGAVEDPSGVVARARQAGAYVAVATDLLALTLLTPPGEWDADVAVGSAQRFGVPLGYGGPHPAFFATRQAHARQIPGRLIGVSADAHGRTAYRMALQTREQHIRRERGHLEHLHGAGAAGEHRRLLRCLSRPGRAQRHRPAGAWTGPAPGPGARATRRQPAARMLLRHAAGGRWLGGGRKAASGMRRRRKASTFRYAGETDIGIALDETAGERDVERIVRLFAAVLDVAPETAADDAAGQPPTGRRPCAGPARS